MTLILSTLLSLIVVLAWLHGWRASVMSTPSMGTAAPVGSLVISRPVDGDQVHVGEIIVFHPPARGATTFVHRVIAIAAGRDSPAIRTRGDLNGAPDPWILHRADVLGVAVARIPDIGFVLQALPAIATQAPANP